MNYSLEGKDITFQLYSSSTSVDEGNTVQVTLTASGNDAVPGLQIPYSIIGSVRAADIKTQTMFGLFTLDRKLMCVLNIAINKDPYIESTVVPLPKQLNNVSPITTIYPSLYIPSSTTDTVVYAEILTLGLYYKPSVYLDITINDTTVLEPDTRVTSHPDTSPSFSLNPLTTSVTEGDSATFLVKFKNVLSGFKFAYEAYDNVLQTTYKDYFYTNDSGSTYIHVPTTATGKLTRQLITTITKYPTATSTIQVNTPELKPLINGYISYIGDTSVVLPAGISLKFHIIGGGGAGGSTKDKDTYPGSTGGDSYIDIGMYGKYIAKAGTGGYPTSGGFGGDTSITPSQDSAITYEVINQVSGNNAYLSNQSTKQFGGDSVAPNIKIFNSAGAGGSGSTSTMIQSQWYWKSNFWGSHHKEWHDVPVTVFNGGGGSGGYLCIKLNNNSKSDIEIGRAHV